ncbi:MAG: Lipid A biosynthesis lauroyltransferase [Chlamydiae bacterium]|nr:Lipid A biosynthesis lauroyltransferase [Chlamydiota bacterium]
MLITYILIRIITFPLALLPYKALHFLGKRLGSLAYYLIPKFRKRALSNLALAKDLNLSNAEIRQVAKRSFQSALITCLEYPKIAREKHLSKIVTAVNPEKAHEIINQGKAVIFFCGHQANWELLFLEGTTHMPGVAIGRPIKNKYLYDWILQIRQKFGGKIVPPKNGIKEGLRALKNGAFFGIVGDQGMPGSGYSSSFLGRLAWTSPLPALLAYKTNRPIIVATTTRRDGHYYIHYSEPLYPNNKEPKEQEIKRLMDAVLDIYEQSIKKNPHEWLWIHNRWKQQTRDEINSPYRHDSLAIILPEDQELAEKASLFRELYPREHITLFLPKSLLKHTQLDAELIPYTHINEVFRDDLRFKLIFNFTKNSRIEAHYKKKSALATYHFDAIDTSLKKKVKGA